MKRAVMLAAVAIGMATAAGAVIHPDDIKVNDWKITRSSPPTVMVNGVASSPDWIYSIPKFMPKWDIVEVSRVYGCSRAGLGTCLPSAQRGD